MLSNKKVLVGISGGVDSSYVLSLLKREGNEVVGAYLIMKDSDLDCNEPKKTADEVGVPYISIDCRDDFKRIVVGNFIKEYSLGRTPNPCIICNREIKLQYLYKYAVANGFDKIATGHYCKVENGNIYVADDLTKDQSYMLWSLTERQRDMLICPLGSKTKQEIRDESKKIGLSNHNKKDSLDICFVPNGDYASFLVSQGVDLPNARFVHRDGRDLGPAKSIISYTVGQRRGLGLSMDRSVYVTKLCPISNTVTVDYEEGIYSNRFKISAMNYHSGDFDIDDIYVKIRYSAKPVKCSIQKINETRADITTQDPCKAVTPGQSAVFYDSKGKLLFGGFIE